MFASIMASTGQRETQRLHKVQDQLSIEYPCSLLMILFSGHRAMQTSHEVQRVLISSLGSDMIIG